MSKCAIAGRECPRTSDQSQRHYCPAWHADGVVFTNQQTSQEKVLHCAFEALMPSLVEVIKASNRPAAAIESTRNELAQGFAKVATVLDSAMRLEHKH